MSFKNSARVPVPEQPDLRQHRLFTHSFINKSINITTSHLYALSRAIHAANNGPIRKLLSNICFQIGFRLHAFDSHLSFFESDPNRSPHAGTLSPMSTPKKLDPFPLSALASSRDAMAEVELRLWLVCVRVGVCVSES